MIKDFDNILTYDEADGAYLVFKNTIAKFANLDPSKDGTNKLHLLLHFAKNERTFNNRSSYGFTLQGTRKKTCKKNEYWCAIFALVSAATLPELIKKSKIIT